MKLNQNDLIRNDSRSYSSKQWEIDCVEAKSREDDGLMIQLQVKVLQKITSFSSMLIIIVTFDFADCCCHRIHLQTRRWNLLLKTFIGTNLQFFESFGMKKLLKTEANLRRWWRMLCLLKKKVQQMWFTKSFFNYLEHKLLVSLQWQ